MEKDDLEWKENCVELRNRTTLEDRVGEKELKDGRDMIVKVRENGNGSGGERISGLGVVRK